MESLCNYASDDENSSSPKTEPVTKLTRTNGMEADANYEQVTMDMSEQESNHSSIKSLKLKDRTSPSSSASSPTSVSQTPRSHHTRKHEHHSDTKTSSSDEEKIKSHSRHKRNKSRDRHSKKHSRRSRSRSNGRKRSRRSRSHSRTKKRSRRSRSRSRSESRNGSSRRSSPYSRRDSKNHKKRSRSRSKSKEKYTSSSHNYFIEKKANNKRQILDKLGIELKVPLIGSSAIPSTTQQVTPQQLLQKSMEAQVEKVKVQTGIELPSYYNPVAVNPNKYAEQIQKRKLLWGNKQNDVVKQVEESKPAATMTNKTATIWQSTKFGDQDGKVTAKFKRLMGIKDNETGVNNQTPQQGQSKDIIKKQEEMFNSMESQYEVARMATHTHRGLGLGFGTFQQR